MPYQQVKRPDLLSYESLNLLLEFLPSVDGGSKTTFLNALFKKHEKARILPALCHFKVGQSASLCRH